MESTSLHKRDRIKKRITANVRTSSATVANGNIVYFVR